MPPERDAAVRETPSQRRPRLERGGRRPGRLATQVRLIPGIVIPGTRYRIMRWLGDGGMGVVYEAEHIDIERRVAVQRSCASRSVISQGAAGVPRRGPRRRPHRLVPHRRDLRLR